MSGILSGHMVGKIQFKSRENEGSVFTFYITGKIKYGGES